MVAKDRIGKVVPEDKSLGVKAAFESIRAFGIATKQLRLLKEDQVGQYAYLYECKN